jgi:sodium/proline symporter
MVSGAVFFESSFGASYHTGLYIVGGVVVAYTLFCVFLATDFIQGLMMLIALMLVPAIGIFKRKFDESVRLLKQE